MKLYHSRKDRYAGTYTRTHTFTFIQIDFDMTQYVVGDLSPKYQYLQF
jgi:hypothetical protein